MVVNTYSCPGSLRDGVGSLGLGLSTLSTLDLTGRTKDDGTMGVILVNGLSGCFSFSRDS